MKQSEKLFEEYLKERVKQKDFSNIHSAKAFFNSWRNNFIDFAEFIINKLKEIKHETKK